MGSMATNRWDNDTEFQDAKVATVTGTPQNYWITKDDGWTLGCPSEFEPKPGDSVRTFGKGIGFQVRGLIVAGREVWYKTADEQAEIDRKWREEYDAKQALIPKRPVVTLHGRTFSHEMREVSGFGGGYEEACRRMVLAGVEHLSTWQGDAPKVGESDVIVGVHMNQNDAAQALEDAMVKAGGDDLSGAMVQFSIRHARRAHHIGWYKYVEESVALQAKEDRDESPESSA